jgi:choline dehydrogenase-like flavoprotein
MHPRTDFDCIVVGAGAAGSIIAAIVAEAGRRVLLVERGPHLSYRLDGRRDHLRNQAVSAYGHNAGPSALGSPRVIVGLDGVELRTRPTDAEYHNNAAVVGGGTVVYGAQAWRFSAEDFRMASLYGVPEGSSLVDWPIQYDDLAPHYTRAEHEIGVAGAGASSFGKATATAYPMPPVPQRTAAGRLAVGASALGIDTVTPPLLINTVARAGRAACIECGSCIGFPCPSDSKNGTQNTMLPRALATGNCELHSEATAVSIDTDNHGNVIGVTIVEETDGEAQARSLRSKVVVLSGGAVETARLLLMSRSRSHPAGLGNAFGNVGRNLQGHLYPTAYGLFEQQIYDPHGPGVTIATTAYSHGNDGIIGGGMLADDFIALPVNFWRSMLPPDIKRWGYPAKDFMRHAYRRVIAVRGPVHEIPNPEARVQLDPTVRDRFGLPVARLSGIVHPETLRSARFMYRAAQRWLDASGAVKVWGTEPSPRLSGGQHQAGTCRMGNDPQTSVTDRWGRVWSHDNLFVCDGSLHPTNGGFNPVLTIMALAFRNADHIISQI